MPDFSQPHPLTPEHDLSAFDCGKPPLDAFLKQHALDKQNAMLSRTYVVTSNSQIAGYYTLALVVVERSETPKSIGRGMPDAIPAVLMARFAVDKQFQGQNLGRSLFTDAIQRTWALMKSGPAPARFFIVDAKDEDAKSFYERFDMIPSPQNPLRLFLSYKTVRAIFEASSTP